MDMYFILLGTKLLIVYIFSICICELQTASGVSSFSDVKSAVDAVVEILQSGIPMARIGKLTLNP